MEITVQKITPEQAQGLGTDTWSPWSCEPMEFDWVYDATEKAYILEGKAKVKARAGQEVEFGAGDLVVFPQGLHCTWTVVETIRKVYKFE